VVLVSRRSRVALKAPNGVAERRLRNPQLCSGLGEAAFPRDGEECKQIVEVLAPAF